MSCIDRDREACPLGSVVIAYVQKIVEHEMQGIHIDQNPTVGEFSTWLQLHPVALIVRQFLMPLLQQGQKRGLHKPRQRAADFKLGRQGQRLQQAIDPALTNSSERCP